MVTTPLLPMTFKGGGDVVSALLPRPLPDRRSQPWTRSHRGDDAATVLERTHAAGSEEMLLVQEQEAIASPDTNLRVSQIR